MKPLPMFGLCLALLLLASNSNADWASDACSDRAVQTFADVTVSDGSRFQTESLFHTHDNTAIRHIRDNDQLIAVEGPAAWVRADDAAQLGSEFHKLFALGHQYHAFLLYFDAIVGNARDTDAVRLGDGQHPARSGDYPYGGTVHRVASTDPDRPLGLVFEFPELPPISATFHDWRMQHDQPLPFHIQIDDGERVFDYRYTKVETANRSPAWLHAALPAPELDVVQIYRLHRQLLIAHCAGDAESMATLSAADITTASNGRLSRIDNAALLSRFTSVFERLDYTEYYDIETPFIEVAASGDLGWLGVNVRSVGTDKSNSEPFDNQWAWFMPVRKVNGRWLHAGNAANLAR